MYKLILISSFMLFSLNVHGKNKLAEYCENDPSGELYSSSWDAHTHDFLEEIGLSEQRYRDLIDSIDPDKYEINSFGDYVELLKDDFPELEYKFVIWKLKTCINDGYEHLHGNT